MLALEEEVNQTETEEISLGRDIDIIFKKRKGKAPEPKPDYFLPTIRIKYPKKHKPTINEILAIKIAVDEYSRIIRAGIQRKKEFQEYKQKIQPDYSSITQQSITKQRPYIQSAISFFQTHQQFKTQNPRKFQQLSGYNLFSPYTYS